MKNILMYAICYTILRICYKTSVALSCVFGAHSSHCWYSSTPRSVGWASERTYLFTAAWNNRRALNIAVYTCIATSKLPILSSLFHHVLTCPDVFYSMKWRALFQVPDVCFSHKCLRRFGKSHYIYAEFILQTFEQVTSLQLAPPRQTSGGKVAVLIEPREHPLFEYVVKQVMGILGPKWSLQLFLSDENIHVVRTLLEIHPGKPGQHIKTVNLRDFGLHTSDMNDNVVQSALSVHEALYKTIESEHILWFQLDVLLRHPVPQRMISRPFLGSEWRGCEYPSCIPSICEKICGGGNSGLSLRRRSIFLRLASRGLLPEDLWGEKNTTVHGLKRPDENFFISDDLYDNTDRKWFEDDLLLSFKLASLNLLRNDGMQRDFAVGETIGLGDSPVDPVGLHKPWSAVHINPYLLLDLLEEPFEAAHMMHTNQEMMA